MAGLHRQRGLTLVELMVATTLSLVLLGGVLLVFSANKATYQMQSGLGTLQENGRYAIGQISRDLQLAGFSGCLSPHVRISSLKMQAKPNPPATDFLVAYMEGEAFGGVNNQTGTLTFGGRAMYTGPAGAGTDAIEIRGPLRSAFRYVTDAIPDGNAIEISGTGSGFAVNEYMVVGDCTGANIFRATAVTENTTDNKTTIAADATHNEVRGRLFELDSVVMELATHTYFVGATGRSYVDAAGANQPVTALYRFDGNNSEELVEGVEDLQIQFALDTDANGTVDSFADPGGVADWSEVVAVRISLLMNSVDRASSVAAPYTYFPASTVAINPDADDLRLRQEFTALVSVRNSIL